MLAQAFSYSIPSSFSKHAQIRRYTNTHTQTHTCTLCLRKAAAKENRKHQGLKCYFLECKNHLEIEKPIACRNLSSVFEWHAISKETISNLNKNNFFTRTNWYKCFFFPLPLLFFFSFCFSTNSLLNPACCSA